MTKLHVISGTQVSGEQDVNAGRAMVYSRAGITVVEMEEDEGLAFFTADMLRHNMILREEIRVFDESVETRISVKHFNEHDAGEWYMYDGDLLAPIQVYRIVKAIFDAYNEFSSLESFLQFLNTMSVASISAGMQSVERNKQEIQLRVQAEVEEVREEA